jgi:uncharacterized repeat protein (TIGR03806 family)
MMWRKFLAAAVIISVFIVACNQEVKEPVKQAEAEVPASNADMGLGPTKLSEYALFKGRMADMVPADGIMPYDLATPLFSDYAHKLRFVKLPAGQKAKYDPKEVFDFPVGTTLIKTFYYPTDFRDESKGRKLMETRLLIHKDSGWVALPFIWNDEQTEAYLEVTGGRKDISWTHYDGSKKQVNYVVPNINQCKGCHVKNEVMQPIGPTARQLNKNLKYADGEHNELEYWAEAGILSGYSKGSAPKAVVWNDPATGSLDERARLYLDINCGHCHTEEGPANTSGLHLDIDEKDKAKLGYQKAPVAAGRGSGGLKADIIPGHPEESILLYRMNSDDPGIMMPELGRKMIHTEGVELVREWIASLK